uniref:Uncharacterized protein n=1 Tax=Globodera rostochiensis TaxID=31243 RepID=A0A914IBG1_GLORO
MMLHKMTCDHTEVISQKTYADRRGPLMRKKMKTIICGGGVTRRLTQKRGHLMMKMMTVTGVGVEGAKWKVCSKKQGTKDRVSGAFGKTAKF